MKQGAQRFWLFIIIGLFFAGPAQGLCRSVQGAAPEANANPIVIKSDTLEADDAQNRITFTGSVKAKKDDLVIECREMVVFYRDSRDETADRQGRTEIDRIVATGEVRIERAQGGTATAGKAVYFQETEKVVLTENPVVKKGRDHVEGHRITLFLEEDRSIAEGSEEEKVTATIFPKEQDR